MHAPSSSFLRSAPRRRPASGRGLSVAAREATRRTDGVLAEHSIGQMRGVAGISDVGARIEFGRGACET